MSSPTKKDKLRQRCRELGIEFRLEQTARELEGKLIAHQLPDGMGKRIKQMFLQTWGAVASDWLEAYPIRGECRGDAVQEAVADADRFDAYGGDREAASLWRTLHRDHQDKILEWVFPRREMFGC